MSTDNGGNEPSAGGNTTGGGDAGASNEYIKLKVVGQVCRNFIMTL